MTTWIVGGGLDPDLEDVRWYNRVARTRVVNVFLANFLRVSNKEMYASKAEVQELVPLLERIRCPVLIIHGRRLSEADITDFIDRHPYLVENDNLPWNRCLLEWTITEERRPRSSRGPPPSRRS